MRIKCLRVLLGKTLRNTLILMAICLSVLNMINWVYYSYSEALIETYNKYSAPTGVVFNTRVISNPSSVNPLSKAKNGSAVSPKRRYPFFDPGESYSENGILMEIGPPLDTKDVRKKKLNFDPSKYPLELDLPKLTQYIFDGKKIKNKPINPHPFQYVYNAENACPHENLHLVVLVKSRASNTRTRDVIRKTWGNQKNYKGVSIVFLLGHMKGWEKNISNESNKYKDIVQENFVDDYSNNTLKTIMGYNWVVRHCHSIYLWTMTYLLWSKTSTATAAIKTRNPELWRESCSPALLRSETTGQSGSLVGRTIPSISTRPI